ncbi:PhzF family phenazine biosynthesis protein [Kistimonas scapharcae]|uniref:PhzF family phenazine biosynthesis protein n=1 Tax=Kistimonas scapharcae TaxID=1036133 RepID=A0ABP8V6N0_9GAMM
MKTLPYYQIDAFTDRLFGGNPAAVIPLQSWLPDACMQQLAKENNLSETAFFVRHNDRYHIRWFAPVTEVQLCGHATLAASYVIRHELGDSTHQQVFDSLSGELKVRFQGELIELNFPMNHRSPIRLPDAIARQLPFTPLAAFTSHDDLLILAPDEVTVAELSIDFTKLPKGVIKRGVIITAASERESVDFVSRWFGGPEVDILEDPVTGSAHTLLTPFWAEKLDKPLLRAEQLSARRGKLECELLGDRVYIRGGAVKYLEGTIQIP